MDSETQKKWLDSANNFTLKGKLLSSCSLKEYLELVEMKVEKIGNGMFSGITDELKFVDDLVIAIEFEAKDVNSWCLSFQFEVKTLKMLEAL